MAQARPPSIRWIHPPELGSPHSNGSQSSAPAFSPRATPKSASSPPAALPLLRRGAVPDLAGSARALDREREFLRERGERVKLTRLDVNESLSMLAHLCGRLTWVLGSSGSAAADADALADDDQTEAALKDLVESRGEVKRLNEVVERYHAKIWIRSVKVLVLSVELVPAKIARSLLEAVELSHLETLSSAKVVHLLGPSLEELPPLRWTALGSLCALLQRDRRSRPFVAAAFGPCILLPRDAPRASYRQLQSATSAIEMMISYPETLFARSSTRGSSLPDGGQLFFDDVHVFSEDRRTKPRSGGGGFPALKWRSLLGSPSQSAASPASPTRKKSPFDDTPFELESLPALKRAVARLEELKFQEEQARLAGVPLRPVPLSPWYGAPGAGGGSLLKPETASRPGTPEIPTPASAAAFHAAASASAARRRSSSDVARLSPSSAEGGSRRLSASPASSPTASPRSSKKRPPPPPQRSSLAHRVIQQQQQ